MPVGPTDGAARRQLHDCLARAEDADVDLERAAPAAEGLTAADIREVWNGAAQRAFERELTTGRHARVTTDDPLAAIATHRPSLSNEDLTGSERQVREFARI